MMDFNNKVVIVTGSSSGIGASTAIEFIKAGANVTIVGRNETKLNDVAKKCEEAGRKPLVVRADVSQEAEVVIKETIKQYGKLDILVNNAGIVVEGRLLDGTIMNTYDKIMNTNLRAVVELTNLAVPYLIETKGNIINISSVRSTTVPTEPKFIMYTVSKAALDHFTKGAAKELAEKGIRVNAINPGPVRTDIFENVGHKSEELERVWEVCANRTALKRVAEPVEIADLVLFLASEKAKSITGSCFLCDNGLLLK